MATDLPGKQTKGSGSPAPRPPEGDGPAPATSPRRGKMLWRNVRRFPLLATLLIVGFGATGFAYQSIASAQDARNYPPPGKLIDVGGYRLHLYCTGAVYPGSPTVILEAGLGGTSLEWSKVQPGVASFTHVCSYDRAGHGWSDMGPLPRTDKRIVTELHTLLARAGVPGPYVLVGHSSGGLIMRLYASTYLEQVAGLVLVDSAHEDQNRYPELRPTDANLLSLCQVLAPFGIPRLLGSLDGNVAEEPPTVQPAAKALLYQTRYCQIASEEEAAWDESVEEVRAARHSFGALPLVVLTRGVLDRSTPEKPIPPSWLALQKDLVSLS
ncbi:MAG TPA: alpha/beta hydrolase, partial [Ktedonobacteraceae bacterium]|nr:alpha/beta hydrolase [Ktedonobacteraceae bacterium]